MSKKPFSGGRRNARPGGPMGGGPGMPAEKARDFKGAILKTAKYLKPYTIAIIVVVIFAIGSTVLAVAGPKVLGQITNQISEDYVRMQFYENVTENLPAGTVLPPGTTGEDILAQLPEDARAGFEENIPEAYRDSLLKMSFDEKPKIRFDIIENIALTLLTIYIVSALFSYIQSFIMSGVTQKITYRFREDISKKIGRIPLRYFDSRTHGDILSRVTNDVDTINQSLGQSLTQMLTSISTIVGIFVMMLTISWQMTLVTLVTLPIALILIGLVIKRSQKFFASQQQSIGEIGGHVEEMYAGHTVMKLFNGEKRSVEKFKKINDELYKSGWKSQFFSGLMMPIMIFIGNLGYVGVCVLGGYLVIKGHVRPGDVQAFMQYVRQFNQPIAQIANISSVLQSTAAAAERVFEFLEEDEEIPESVNPAVLKNPKGHVEFDHVSFGYNKDKTIIGDFTCKIEPGQKVAIVGPTGAGKTTIVNLLMRFYDVDSGSIKIDGVDIREMKRADLRRMFGMVLQDTWLFNGSILDNIGYGKLGCGEEEIKSAARAAHADRFIKALPDSYDMVLNEEASNISQGQKQLLTIARAMLADPPMLILDEATSSVDTRTELLIQRAMNRLMKGRTSFVIAHRLSTIKDSDLILVMKDGNIIEQGTHVELLAQNGFYTSLYNSQFASKTAG